MYKLCSTGNQLGHKRSAADSIDANDTARWIDKRVLCKVKTRIALISTLLVSKMKRCRPSSSAVSSLALRLYVIWNITLLSPVDLNKPSSSSASSSRSILFCFAQQTDLSCDPFVSCPSEGNGICESELGADDDYKKECERGDCSDCIEFCLSLSFDCNSCISSGCYWCPGDAKCYNTDLYVLDEEESSCTEPQDYFHISSTGKESCSNVDPDNFFRYVRAETGHSKTTPSHKKIDNLHVDFPRNSNMHLLPHVVTHCILHKLGYSI